MDSDSFNNELNSSYLTNKNNVLSQGETILSLLLPFLDKGGLAIVSGMNHHLHENSSRYLFYQVDQTYPQVSLDGSPTSNPGTVKMYLPPRFVYVPGFTPTSIFQTNGPWIENIFPMPASQQPQIHCDPRLTQEFASMSWTKKAMAIEEYAAKFELCYASLMTHHEEYNMAYSEMAAVELKDRAMVQVQGHPLTQQEKICILCRGLILKFDLLDVPFTDLYLDDEQLSKIQVCFFHRIIKESLHQRGGSDTNWPIHFSQWMLKETCSFCLLLIVAEVANDMHELSDTTA